MPHYDNAPIVEALIDFQVRYDGTPRQEDFDACKDRLADRFNVAMPITFFQMNIPGPFVVEGAPVSTPPAPQVVGLRLANNGNDRVLQIQQRGFTYSHLAPYSEWAVLAEEARSAWAIFRETCRPVSIIRAALRYINRIVVPAPRIDIEEYFNLYPKTVESMGDPILGAFMQVVLAQPGEIPGSNAVVNFAMEPPPGPQQLSFILDLDLSNPSEFDPNSDQVWGLLEHLRNRKNEIFEAAITDRTRRLFDAV